MKLILSVLLVFLTTFAQNIKTGKRLLSVNTARSMGEGQFSISTGLDFFTQGITNTSISSKSYNAWQINSDLSFAYGVTENLDITLSSILYQDTQKDKNNFPSGIVIEGKLANINLYKRALLLSANGGLKFGIGNHHNIPYVDYFAEGMGVTADIAFSFFTDEYLPDRKISFHANIGTDLNFDSGKEIKTAFNLSTPLNENTTKLKYAFGTNIPTDLIDIIVEINGYSFMSEPNKYLFGRESRNAANIGFRYKFSPYMLFDFGFGMNLGTPEETTLYDHTKVDNKKVENSNYSSWKAFLNLNFIISPSNSYGTSRNEIERNEYKQKVQIFKSLIEEQDNTELIQQELERLKQEREKAEKELEELKRILDDRK